MMALFLLFFGFVLPPASIAGNAESAAYAIRGFHNVLLRCPDRVWPGIDWSEFQILFSDPSSKNAWLVSSSSSVPEIVRKDQTVADIFEDNFKVGFLDFRGQRTVAVNTSGLTPGATFRLAVRRLFQEAEQNQWENSTYDDRGVLYPLLSEPRYFRKMAFEKLKLAYFAVNEKRSPESFLSGAAYWTQRWRRAYPEELPMRTDSLEGTALYVEQIAYLLTEVGCGARANAFYAAFRKLVEPKLALFTHSLLASEGKLLGSLSSFVLSFTQPRWTSKMNGSLMPSDLVLEGVRPERQAEDFSLREEYRLSIEEQQAQAYYRVNPVLVREKDRSYIRVSIPARWQKGALSVSHSYVLRNRLDTAILTFGEQHDFKGERGLIHVPDNSTIIQSNRNGCGGAFHFLIPAYEVAREKKRFTATHWGHSFSFEGGRKNVNGFTWLCPTE